jgi:hypothetical protein
MTYSRKELTKMLDANGGKLSLRGSAKSKPKPKIDTGGMTPEKAHELARMLKMKSEIIAETREEIMSELMSIMPPEWRKAALKQRMANALGKDEAMIQEQKMRDRAEREKRGK